MEKDRRLADGVWFFANETGNDAQRNARLVMVPADILEVQSMDFTMALGRSQHNQKESLPK